MDVAYGCELSGDANLDNFQDALKRSTVNTDLVISLMGYGGYKTFAFPDGSSKNKNPLHYNVSRVLLLYISDILESMLY